MRACAEKRGPPDGRGATGVAWRARRDGRGVMSAAGAAGAASANLAKSPREQEACHCRLHMTSEECRIGVKSRANQRGKVAV